jgi:hypothetical protein
VTDNADGRPMLYAISRNGFLESCLSELQASRPDARIEAFGRRSVALSGDALAAALAGVRELRDALAADPLLLLRGAPTRFGKDYPPDEFVAHFTRLRPMVETSANGFTSLQDDDGVAGAVPDFLEALAVVMSAALQSGQGVAYLTFLNA